MDGVTLYIKQLKPYLYLLDEEHQATGYLVIGENKAVLIDTMSGLTNLRAEGKTAEDESYPWFAGVGKKHRIPLMPGKHYQQSDSVVCYDPENVLPEQPRSLRNTYDRGIV